MAQKSQQAYLSVATAAGSAKVVTAITAAAPGVVSSTSHGLANGTVGLMAGVVGMTAVNNRAFVVANTATNAFDLKGTDTSLSTYSAYVSGGTFTPQTMTEVGEVRSMSPAFDGEAAEIDVTNLRSSGKEFLTGLPDNGSVSLTLWLPTAADTGQTKLRTLRESQTSAVFSITLSSGLICAFVGLVKSFSVSGLEVDGAVQCSCSIRVTNQPAWFA